MYQNDEYMMGVIISREGITQSSERRAHYHWMRAVLVLPAFLSAFRHWGTYDGVALAFRLYICTDTAGTRCWTIVSFFILHPQAYPALYSLSHDIIRARPARSRVYSLQAVFFFLWQLQAGWRSRLSKARCCDLLTKQWRSHEKIGHWSTQMKREVGVTDWSANVMEKNSTKSKEC